MDEPIHYLYDIHQSQPETIQILAEASIQAYKLFDTEKPTQPCEDKIKPPAGFEYLESWTGIDEIFGHNKEEEVYGAVFRSNNAPYQYIFAFRGTASKLDVLDDLGAEHHSFCAFNKDQTIPDDLKVESGFYDIYQTSKNNIPSMQSQLFKLIDQYQASDKPIASLLVTGHSLGAAICQLFSLDLAISRPTIQSLNFNFASPRVGNAAFVRFYESTTANNTLRIQNTHDKVPCVPPTSLGYQHTSAALLVAFYKKSLLGKLDYLDSHSLVNYLAVINCAIESDQGYCDCKALVVESDEETLVAKKANPDDIGDIF